jgi:hypothetical protein
MYASYEYGRRAFTKLNGGEFTTPGAFAAGWLSGAAPHVA